MTYNVYAAALNMMNADFSNRLYFMSAPVKGPYVTSRFASILSLQQRSKSATQPPPQLVAAAAAGTIKNVHDYESRPKRLAAAR